MDNLLFYNLLFNKPSFSFPPYAMRFLLLAWYNQSITLLLLSLRSSVRTSAIQVNLIALGLSSASY